MKKAKGKKLTLDKLNITKLEQMTSIKGGVTTREPGGINVYYQYTKSPKCPTITYANTVLRG